MRSPTFTRLQQWNSRLNVALRPDPAAEPKHRDYGYYLNVFADQFARCGRGVMAELEADGRRLNASLRANGKKVVAWFSAWEANFRADVEARIESKKAVAESALRTWESSQNAQGVYFDDDWWPESWVRRLLDYRPDAHPRVWGKWEKHVMRLGRSLRAFASKPMEGAPLLDVIGARNGDVFPRVDGFKDEYGLWAALPAFDTGGYTDRVTGEVVPGEPAWDIVVFYATEVWRERLSTFPVEALAQMRSAIRGSPWYTANVLYSLIHAKHEGSFAGAVLLLWELHRPFMHWCGLERAISSRAPLNPYFDWPKFRRWRLSFETLESEEAAPFALVIGFLMDRIAAQLKTAPPETSKRRPGRKGAKDAVVPGMAVAKSRLLLRVTNQATRSPRGVGRPNSRFVVEPFRDGAAVKGDHSLTLGTLNMIRKIWDGKGADVEVESQRWTDATNELRDIGVVVKDLFANGVTKSGCKRLIAEQSAIQWPADGWPPVGVGLKA